MGELLITILAGLATFERHLIKARTDEGRKRAQARGVRFGRPMKLSAYQIKEALVRGKRESQWRILVGAMALAIQQFPGSAAGEGNLSPTDTVAFTLTTGRWLRGRTACGFEYQTSDRWVSE
jgi:resolvase-like protein